MSELLMPEARFADGARVEIVQPSARDLRPGRMPYAASEHKGRLSCMFCDASLHHNAGTPVIAGGHPGRQAHFVTDPGSRHGETCLLPPRPQDGRATEYDDTLGWRIHINTLDYSDQFNLAAGPYERDEEGRLRLKNPALKTHRPVAVTDVKHIATLIRRGQFDRLRASLVMMADRAQPLAWDEFLIRYMRGGDEGYRYKGLMNRLAWGGRQPAVLEIVTEGGGGRCVESQPVRTLQRGLRLDIIPRVWLDNRDDTRVMGSMTGAGRYLVLGVPRLSQQFEGRKGLVRYLNISVTDRRQVMPADIDRLMEEGRLKASRRKRQLPGLAAE